MVELIYCFCFYFFFNKKINIIFFNQKISLFISKYIQLQLNKFMYKLEQFV